MWKPKIAAPTFLFRDKLEKEMPKILEQYAQIGFDGVEFVGFGGWDKKEIKKMLLEYSLTPAGNNLSLYDIMDNLKDVVAVHEELGFYSLTAGSLRKEHLPGGEYFGETVEWFTKLGKECSAHGLKLLYHNHDFELREKINGKTHLDILMDSIPTEFLLLQPDLGWMQIGGADPVSYLQRYQNRCPFVHVKDFFATDMEKIGNPFDLEGKRGGAERGFFEFRPTGYGISNIASQLPYIKACNPEWLVTCQDTGYERNSFEDLRLGLEYVKKLCQLGTEHF
ncbi:MAG: sugar phosphate isomerase/epimerase [Coprococcus sp.]|nr:sugar phosphate isomerase/epimerase [Coprococcus sp.]